MVGKGITGAKGYYAPDLPFLVKCKSGLFMGNATTDLSCVLLDVLGGQLKPTQLGMVAAWLLGV